MLEWRDHEPERSDANAVVLPYQTQEKFALEHTKGVSHNR
jgi:hypothetical protein